MIENSVDHNRLLLEISKSMKDLNRSIINPKIAELRLSDLTPVIEMVAKSRAAYLLELFDIAKIVDGDLPSPNQIKHLRHLRETFDELVRGAQALETAIERGYLDVNS